MKTYSTYLINLDSATERLKGMDEQLRKLSMPYQRVSAVVGDDLREPIDGFSPTAFRIRTGKHTNKREVGCYFSHMKVMRQFLASGDSHALVLEDDAELPEDFARLMDEVMITSEDWDLLRLSSSRKGKYLKIRLLGSGHDLAINTRVLKNTAAYLISRKGAQACLDGLLPMCRPFDVALDRDWTLGIRTACVVPLPVGHGDIPSQIRRAKRDPLWRSTTFHLFHLLDRVQRHLYRHQTAKRVRRSPHPPEP